MLQADGYGLIKDNEPTTRYCVSPEIVLCSEGNTIQFEQTTSYFEDRINKETGLFVREAGGGEWVQIDMHNPDMDIDHMTLTELIDIPSQFNGKTVEIGFAYTSNGGIQSVIWQINNIYVREAGAPINKKDADNSRTQIYDLQGRKLNKMQKGINIVNGKKILVR